MASRSLNKVTLIGNLTRDPELRYTPQGTAVCTFGVATNRSWQTAGGGERQEETEFHRIVAWQKLGELCSQLLFKGRKVYVEGRLQTRKWTGSDGQERKTTEIVIDNMIVLDYRQREGSGVSGEARSYPQRPTAEAAMVGSSGQADDQATVSDQAAAGQTTAVTKAAPKPKAKKPAAKKKVKTPKPKSEEKVLKAKSSDSKVKVTPEDIPF